MKKISNVNFLLVGVLLFLAVRICAGERRFQSQFQFAEIAEKIEWVYQNPIASLGAAADYLLSGRLSQAIDDSMCEQMDLETERKTMAYINQICPESSRSSCNDVYLRVAGDPLKDVTMTSFSNSASGFLCLSDDVVVGSVFDEYTALPRFVVASGLALSLGDDSFGQSFWGSNQVGVVHKELKALEMMGEGDPEGLDLLLRFVDHNRDSSPIGSFSYLTSQEKLLLWSWYKQEKEELTFNYRQFVSHYAQDREIIQKEIEESGFLYDFEKEDFSKGAYVPFPAIYRKMVSDQKEVFEGHLARDTGKVVGAYKKIKQKKSSVN